MKMIAFFNNKGGVGKTSLVYHLSWMFADRGKRVIAADLDPQANLSSMFLNEERLEELWPDGEHPRTISGSIKPLTRGIGDIQIPFVEQVSENLGLIVGDLSLSGIEDRLSDSWHRCLGRDELAFRVTTAFYRSLVQAAEKHRTELIFIDIGPNLGAINRAALIASQHIIIPLAPDLFSLQGLKNLGPALRDWREEWTERRAKNPEPKLDLPEAEMNPVGFIIMQHGIRDRRPVMAYQRWIDRIPEVYRRSVLEGNTETPPPVNNDPFCLATLKHYRSLMPMAMEANKPMFFLKPADGAIGAHVQAVKDCYRDFLDLAKKIWTKCGGRSGDELGSRTSW